MKRTIKLFSAIIGLIVLASACASRTCPTYADNTPSKKVQEVVLEA